LRDAPNSGAEDDSRSAYEWYTWPHSPQTELAIACRRLQQATNRLPAAAKELEGRTAWALRLEQQLAERTTWALEMKKDLEERTAWARRLEQQLQERTAWARRLDRELQQLYRKLEQIAWLRHIHPSVVSFVNRAALKVRDCRNFIRKLTSRHHFSD